MVVRKRRGLKKGRKLRQQKYPDLSKRLAEQEDPGLRQQLRDGDLSS